VNGGSEIHVDRQQPPTLEFAETGGEPILSYLPDDGGWVLHVQHYSPFRMEVSRFGDVDEALSKAQEFLKVPLADTYRLEPERVSLRSDWGEPGGTSYFLDATLGLDGSLRLSGQDLGPTVSYDGEYEYWYTVKAEHVPALVVALGGTPGDDILDVLKQHWSGDAASGLGPGPAIRDSGIEYHFTSYF